MHSKVKESFFFKHITGETVMCGPVYFYETLGKIPGHQI